MPGESTIVKSVFMFNAGTHRYYGGNVRFLYKECPAHPHISTVHINFSLFLYGKAEPNGERDYNCTPSGLTIFIIGISCHGINVTISNIIADGNQAGNVLLGHKNVAVTNSYSVSNSIFRNAMYFEELGIYISTAYISSVINHTIYTQYLINVTNTTIEGNRYIHVE